MRARASMPAASLATFLMAALIACSQDGLSPGGAVRSVMVAPSSATVAVGASLSLSAELRDAQGELVTGRRISWASENASIAEVAPDGRVTGRQVGTVLIAASAWGKDAFALVTVNPVPVASVRVLPANRSMYVGETVQLDADVLDQSGDSLTGRPVDWSSSNEAVATVTASGFVTALAAGGAIITASSEGRSAAASITVSAVPVASIHVTPDRNDIVVGQTTQLTAEVRDGAGQLLAGRSVAWSTDRPAVATVTSGGLVTGLSAGSAAIMATSEGKTATATVIVSPRPVSAVIVSPDQLTIIEGQSAPLTAVVTDDQGLTLAGRPVIFSSSDHSVATVSSSGTVTGIAPGSATITATSEGKVGTSTVTVLPEPVATVEVSPSPASVIAGQSLQLIATARNASGQPLAGRMVTWTSGAPGLARVSSSGLVTGLSPGTAVIIAAVDGRLGSASVTVRDVPVASVTVTPPTTTAPVGQPVSLTATLRDAAGNAVDGRVVSWSSSDNAVATVSSGGVVTGLAAGSATITATSEGQVGTATVTIVPEPVATVEVSPSPASVTVGQQVQLSATPRSAAGQVLVGRTVTWTSATPVLATASPTGLVSGAAAGNATIHATIDGIVGSAMVVVSDVPVASVSVTPSTTTLDIGQAVTLAATPLDAGGKPLTGRPVAWTSDAPSIAAVNTSGVVTAIASGTATITATSGGQSGTAAITVNTAAPPPVATVLVSPGAASLIVGGTQAVSATTLDSAGNTLTGRPVTWASADPNVATVDQAGLVTATGVGSTTVTATSEGQVGTAKVDVAAPTVVAIAVTPSSGTVNVAWTTGLSAVATDANGNPMTGAPVTWSSSDPAVASVSATGVVTGVAPGVVTVTASSGSVTGTASITVQLAPVALVVVTPPSPTITQGQAVQLTATLYDQLNNVLTGRVVTWSSADATKVPVDATGLASGLRKGVVVITATSEGQSATSSVRVR